MKLDRKRAGVFRRPREAGDVRREVHAALGGVEVVVPRQHDVVLRDACFLPVPLERAHVFVALVGVAPGARIVNNTAVHRLIHAPNALAPAAPHLVVVA